MGRAARRRDRDAGVREPGVRAGRPRAPAGRSFRRRGRRAADGSRRRPRAAPARSRRRLGSRGDVHRRPSASTGPAGERGTATRRRGTSSSRPRRSTPWSTRSRPPPARPLAERLIDCLAAAQAAGGDRRGQQSAALLVVERDGGYAGLSDILVDLRTDDHERPVEELRRLYRLHHALFGKTPREDWLPVDDALRAEIGERLARIGYATLDDWAGVENLEERVDGTDSIDPVVLEALRDAS